MCIVIPRTSLLSIKVTMNIKEGQTFLEVLIQRKVWLPSAKVITVQTKIAFFISILTNRELVMYQSVKNLKVQKSECHLL